MLLKFGTNVLLQKSLELKIHISARFTKENKELASVAKPKHF
jgi:hypothetical protein